MCGCGFEINWRKLDKLYWCFRPVYPFGAKHSCIWRQIDQWTPKDLAPLHSIQKQDGGISNLWALQIPLGGLLHTNHIVPVVFYRQILRLIMIDKTRAQNEAPHQCTGVQEALGEQEPKMSRLFLKSFKKVRNIVLNRCILSKGRQLKCRKTQIWILRNNRVGYGLARLLSCGGGNGANLSCDCV